MKRVVAVFGLTLLAAAIAFIASCTSKANQHTAQLAKISPGDSEASVLVKLGQPRIRENADQPFLLYATDGCTNPCATRLWWDLPFLPGIEAWSVELDSSHKVIRTAHWVSS